MAKPETIAADVRQMYPAVADAHADPARRAQEVRRLQQLANILRQAGMDEGENPASAYLRACGIKRHAPRIAVLAKVGIPSAFLCSAAVLRVPEAARVLGLLVEHCGMHPDAITTDDIERFLARERKGNTRGERPSQRERHLLKRAFRLYYAFMGRATPNPVITQALRKQTDLSAFPPACRKDGERLARYAAEHRFTRATERTLFTVFNAYLRFLTECEPARATAGPFAALEDPALALRFVCWRFSVPPDQLPRSVSGLGSIFHLIRSGLAVSGMSETAITDRLIALKRGLRGGKDRGRYDLLTLRSPDPAPAPSTKQVERSRVQFQAELADLRERGAEGKLGRVMRERNLMETPLRTGMRLTTLASCRGDRIIYDEATETVYVDEVVVKANRRRQRILVPETQVGNVTLSRWYLDPTLLELYEESYQLDGYSLFGWLETGDRRCLPWVRARDNTFGPQAKGQLVSPLWRGGRFGYLSKVSISLILSGISKDRLGLQRGSGHPLRRRAAIDFAAAADIYPQAVEALLRMGPGMQARYRVSTDRSPGLLFTAGRPISEIIRRVPIAETVPATREANAEPTPIESAPSLKGGERQPRRRPPSSARISRDELLA